MKKIPTTVVGVDIGSYSLKLVEISGGEVKKFASAPMPDGLVRDGEILSREAMSELIIDTAKQGGIPKGKCAVILPESMVYSRKVSVPAMSEQQLKYSLPYEFRDFVSEEKGRYFYDYAVQSVTEDENGQPKELKLFACAAPRSVIADYRGMLRQSGMSMIMAAPPACAYPGLVADYQRRNGTTAGDCCFIDLGHGSTGIYMYNGEFYNTHRSLNISMADVVSAAADTMHVDEHMALSYVQSNYQDVVNSEACRKVYGDIAVEIVKAINFYNFNNRDNSLGSVFVCGGGAQIPALVETISATLGLKTRDINELLPQCADSDFDAAIYAKAVGIAVQN